MRPNMLLTSSLAFSLLICGCNGEIRTRMWDRSALESELKKECGVKGVIGYYTKYVIEVSILTKLTAADGKVIGPCTPIAVKKVATVTDYEHPYQVWYKYGLLEANKFGVQMSNNIFTAINSESTPDQGKTIENLAHAFSEARPPAVSPAPRQGEAPPPACNSEPYFKQYEAFPHLP